MNFDKGSYFHWSDLEIHKYVLFYHDDNADVVIASQ